jgi:hypothetical protein
MEPGLKLKIEQRGIDPRTARVWLEGIEITQGLHELSVRWTTNEVTEATLTIGINSLELDARTLAALHAIVKISESERE